MTKRTYHLLGVPLRAGSLAPGNENDPKAYREAGFLEMLRSAGCQVTDEGDLQIPSYLPHHSIPPIRNWPAPRIVWDLLRERLAPVLAQEGAIPLLIGCDCSVVLGTVQAMQTVAKDVCVLYVDGDADDDAVDASECQSAAYLATWLLTNPSPFWTGRTLSPDRVMALGFQKAPKSETVSSASMSLAQIREIGTEAAALRVLKKVPDDASIILHLDTDVVHQDDMPTAYFPHDDGLRLGELAGLLRLLLADERIRLIEISEYASLRDPKHERLGSFTAMFAGALGGS